jgi:hypothetical protein
MIFSRRLYNTFTHKIRAIAESTEFKTRKNLVEAGNYLELQFNDIFTIKPIKSDW